MATTQDPRPSFHWGGVCIDCADADELAEFYSRLLGWEVAARDTPATRKGGTGWVALRDPAGGVGLSFQAEVVSASGLAGGARRSDQDAPLRDRGR